MQESDLAASTESSGTPAIQTQAEGIVRQEAGAVKAARSPFA